MAASPEWLETVNRLATIAGQLTTVVHETNNLLQVIRGNAEMLQVGGDLSPAARERALTIVEHAERASDVLLPVLAFARDAAEGVEPVDVAALVRSAVDLRRYAMRKAQVTVAVAADQPEMALANRRRTLQILLNLLTNAEAAVAGRAAARVEAAVRRDNEWVIVDVIDNGDGPGTATAASPSLGIGLRVGEWMAARQGGRLRIDPVPGGGTAARLFLSAA